MKIKQNAPRIKDEKTRKHQPFKDMKVNDCVDIDDKDEWLPSVRYAHGFASKQKPKWKFSSTWIEGKEFGRIRRIT